MMPVVGGLASTHLGNEPAFRFTTGKSLFCYDGSLAHLLVNVNGVCEVESDTARVRSHVLQVVRSGRVTRRTLSIAHGVENSLSVFPAGGMPGTAHHCQNVAEGLVLGLGQFERVGLGDLHDTLHASDLAGLGYLCHCCLLRTSGLT